MSREGDVNPVLAMRGISKRFAGVQALQNVDVAIYSGEVVSLLGENGAGKSTLMKVLGGIHQPDNGEILMDGKAVTIRSVSDAIRLGISFIHQELNVVDNLDIAGNVFLGREPVTGPFRLLDRDRMVRETQPYLDQLGLNFPANMPLDQLSLAQRQMVEIAKALSLKSRILIMDEPTSSLTLTETARLLSVVKELRAQGVGIVYISHRLDEVRQISDRVIGLRDGRNAGGLDREEITHDRMVKLMVGRDLAPANIPESLTAQDHPDLLTLDRVRTRRYPLQEVSLSIRKGEILGMSGLVGSGRSELAMAIFGVEPALSGTIRLNNEPLSIHSPKDAINKKIYLIPEDRRRCGLITEMSIRENIALPALDKFAVFGLVQQGKEMVETTTAAENLRVKTPNVDFLAKNLSGGNQQKVVIAKWLSLGPKVVIFDEPTRGIDVGAKAEIYALIRDLAGKGVGVLMISSDMEEVLMLSDRIAVMHEGQITGVLNRKDCSEEAVMNLAVGGDK